MIRPVQADDAQRITDIYNYYILNTSITFEEVMVSLEEMEKRIKEYTESYPWIVYIEENEIVGYAYATKWRPRSTYRHSVEMTVYVDKDHHRKGIGIKLYEQLIERLKAKDVKVLMAGIAQPNEKSVGLHEKLGFKKVGHFEDIGKKFGRWIDVGYWEYKF